MEIRSVAIIGAGAIGSYFVYGLSKVPEVDMCLIAEGERADRLKRDGLLINGVSYKPAVRLPEEAKGADLLLLATKYEGLLSAFPAAKTIIAENTVVVSLLNGIDSEERISSKLQIPPIPYAFMKISSERVGNRVTFNPVISPGLFIGEKDSSEESERIRAIRNLCRKAGLGFHFCPDIVSEQWRKYTLNICYNLPQAILGVGCGAYYDSEHVSFLRRKLEAEVRMVAKACGISFGPLEDNSSRWLKKARFSTLQDLDNKRHTEIEMFAGVLMQKAAEAGIEVPYTEYSYHVIKALEEKNDGLFDYA